MKKRYDSNMNEKMFDLVYQWHKDNKKISTYVFTFIQIAILLITFINSIIFAFGKDFEKNDKNGLIIMIFSIGISFIFFYMLRFKSIVKNFNFDEEVEKMFKNNKYDDIVFKQYIMQETFNHFLQLVFFLSVYTTFLLLNTLGYFSRFFEVLIFGIIILMFTFLSIFVIFQKLYMLVLQSEMIRAMFYNRFLMALCYKENYVLLESAYYTEDIMNLINSGVFWVRDISLVQQLKQGESLEIYLSNQVIKILEENGSENMRLDLEDTYQEILENREKQL